MMKSGNMEEDQQVDRLQAVVKHKGQGKVKNNRLLASKGDFMDNKNGTIKMDNKRRITLTETRKEMNIIDTQLTLNNNNKIEQKLNREQESSSWNSKENKEIITINKGRVTENMKKK